MKRGFSFPHLTLGLMTVLFFTGSCNHADDLASYLRSKNPWGNHSDEMLAHEGFFGPRDEDFVPLQEQDLQTQFAERAIPQPKDTPGEPGSGIPTLDQFRKPLAHLATIFQNVYFNTDDHLLRNPEFFQVIDKISDYLKKHSNVVVSVAGHCDERASEAYNLSLGARRANYIRSLLVEKGVDPDHIHTVSYGKEQPVDHGHHPANWAKNRRVEFRIYEKN